MGEDLTQQENNQGPNSVEVVDVDYTREWLKWYDEEKIKWADEENKDRKIMTRHERYSNLPTIISRDGEPLFLAQFRQHLGSYPENKRFKEHVAKYERVGIFIRAQMDKLGITADDGKRHLELAASKTLTKEDLENLKGFVGKMEDILQSGKKAGFKSEELV